MVAIAGNTRRAKAQADCSLLMEDKQERAKEQQVQANRSKWDVNNNLATQNLLLEP